jgi:hypothetical protein
MSSGRTWVDADIPKAVQLVRDRIELILRDKKFSIGIDGGKPEHMDWKVSTSTVSYILDFNLIFD